MHEAGLSALETVGHQWHRLRRYHFMERASPFVEHVVGWRFEQGQAAEPFDASEHGQGRALLDLMRQGRAAVALMLPLASCLHLATHGQRDPLGDNTYLVLAGQADGLPGHNALFGRDLQGLRLRAQPVVLSTCQTGLGGVHPDSYIGLGQSFLAAGARCVLVSLWPLPDETTCAFMTRFNAALRGGAQPAEALQITQAAFRADPLTAAGENWAGFQLLGQAWV